MSRTGSGHMRLVSPSGARVTISSSPSDQRHVMNVRADLRRAGLRQE